MNRTTSGLTKDDLAGDVMLALLLTYFAEVENNTNLLARNTDTLAYVGPSFGNAFNQSRISYWFGVPRSMSFPGIAIDVDRFVTISVPRTIAAASAYAFQKALGAILSMGEHLVPEFMFSNSRRSAEGISAVKALCLSHANGERIYAITTANRDTALPALAIDPAVKAEIDSAILAGKNALVSRTQLSTATWTRIGYIIVDADTGAGAYKISGGLNGGSATYDLANVLTLVSLTLSVLLELLVSSAYADDLTNMAPKVNSPNSSDSTLFDCVLTLAWSWIFVFAIFVAFFPESLLGLIVFLIAILALLTFIRHLIDVFGICRKYIPE